MFREYWKEYKHREKYSTLGGGRERKRKIETVFNFKSKKRKQQTVITSYLQGVARKKEKKK